MAKMETMVSCPFCRRVYRMLLDREAAERTRARASCGRCGNSFELAARFVGTGTGTKTPAVISTTPPPAAPLVSSTPPPPPPAKRRAPTVDPRSVDADDLALDDLVRDIAKAAEKIVDAETSSQRIPAMPPPPPHAKPPKPAEAVVEMTADSEDDEDSPAIETARTAQFPAAMVSLPPMPVPGAETVAEAVAAAETVAVAETASPPLVAVARVEEPAAVVEVAPPPVSPEDWLTLADPGLSALNRTESEAARVLVSLIG